MECTNPDHLEKLMIKMFNKVPTFFSLGEKLNFSKLNFNEINLPAAVPADCAPLLSVETALQTNLDKNGVKNTILWWLLHCHYFLVYIFMGPICHVMYAFYEILL